MINCYHIVIASLIAVPINLHLPLFLGGVPPSQSIGKLPSNWQGNEAWESDEVALPLVTSEGADAQAGYMSGAECLTREA